MGVGLFFFSNAAPKLFRKLNFDNRQALRRATEWFSKKREYKQVTLSYVVLSIVTLEADLPFQLDIRFLEKQKPKK